MHIRPTDPQVLDEVLTEFGRVKAQPGEEVGTTPPQERETQQVEAWHARNATVVIDPAAAVERSGIQPVVGGAEPCGPDHRSEAGQIELGRHLGEDGRTRLDRRADEIGHVVLIDPLVDAAEEPGLLQIGIGDEAPQAARAQRRRAADRHEAPNELDAEGLQGLEVDLSSVVASHHLHRCVPASTLEVLHLIPSLVELADPVQPPIDVTSSIRPRQPDVLADRDGDITAGSLQLVRDLYP